MNTNKGTTNDTTLEDEIARLDALPQQLRDLAGLHALDQFGAVEPYLQRYQHPSSREEPTYA
jgi:hypothetical protein